MSPDVRSSRRRRWSGVPVVLALVLLPQGVSAVAGTSGSTGRLFDPVDVAASSAIQPCLDFARKPGSTTPSTTPGAPKSTAGYNGGATLVLALAAKEAADANETTTPQAVAVGTALVKQLRQSVNSTTPGASSCSTYGNSSTNPADDRESASEPTAAGGYSAQDEIWFSSMAAVARTTPWIWNQLSADDRNRTDLVMEAELVSNAFVMSDANPFVNGQGTERTIDGLTNIGRNWPSAYVRGAMLSNIALSSAYFSPTVAADKLAAWATTPGQRRASFLVEATRLKLGNLKETFGGGTQRGSLAWWAGGTTPVVYPATVPNANSGAPTDAQVATALSGWRYSVPGAASGTDGYKIPVTDPMRLYQAEVNYSYDRPVACGLVNGAGISAQPGDGTTPVPGGTAGRLANAADCAQQPFPSGTPGMLHDLDSRDVSGTNPPQSQWRSSTLSAFIDLRSEIPAQIGLLVSGLWKQGPIGPGGQTGRDLMALKSVGIGDLYSKLSSGFIGVYGGNATISPGNPADYVQRLSAPGSYSVNQVLRTSPMAGTNPGYRASAYDYLSWLWVHGLRAENSPLAMPSKAPLQAAIATISGRDCMDFSRAGVDGETTPGTSPVAKANSNTDQRNGAIGVIAEAAMHGDAGAIDALERQLEFTLKGSGVRVAGTSPDRCIDAIGGNTTTPRNNIGSNEPTAQGGLSSQHELWTVMSFVVAKRTPEVWNWLSAEQKRKIDLTMQAVLVSNAYLMSDKHPDLPVDWNSTTYTQHSIDGNGNVVRTWGPNYREGIYGSLLLAQAYFGNETTAKLEGFDRQAFLQAVGTSPGGAKLGNLEMTFTPRAAPAATDAQIKTAVTNWTSTNDGTQVLRLDRPMEIYRWLTEFTYGGTVGCGLDGGLGIPAPGPAGDYAGFVLGTTGVNDITPSMTPAERDAACRAKLGADFGKRGMLKEFNAFDEIRGVALKSPRSSWVYSYMGFRANMATELGLLAAYGFVPGTIAGTTPTTTTQALWDLRSIGVRDLFKKFDLGYTGFKLGAAEINPGMPTTPPRPPSDYVLNNSALFASPNPQGGLRGGPSFSRDLWYTVLAGSPDAR